jgi:hypothetical protein
MFGKSPFTHSRLLHPGMARRPQAAGAAFDVSFTDSTSSASDLTTYTFSGRAIGAADSTRRVFACIHWATTGSVTGTVSSATIGGVAATVHVEASETGGATRYGTAIISALVPTGTTADIVFTISAACIRAGVGVFRMVNETNTTPHDTASDIVLTGTVLSGTIDILDGGTLIASCYLGGLAASTQTIVWTGATEQYDINPESTTNRLGGAFAFPLSIETSRTISTDMTDCNEGALVAVSWR